MLLQEYKDIKITSQKNAKAKGPGERCLISLENSLYKHQELVMQKKKAMDGFGVKVHEQTTHPKAGIDKKLLEGKEEEERKRRMEERKEGRKEGRDVGNAEQILNQKRTQVDSGTSILKSGLNIALEQQKQERQT